MKVIFTRVALVLAFCTSSLLAVTTSYSHTTTTQAVPFTDTFTLPEFTPPLGDTLTGITISLSYNTTGAVNLFNSATTAQAYTSVETTAALALTAPDALMITTNAVAGPVSGTASGGIVTAVPGLTGSGMLSLVVSSADWSFFEGTGTFSSSLAAGDFNYSVAGSKSLFVQGDTATVGATTTITYAYVTTSSIPEPATMGLIGSALLGIGFFARRRIKKA